MTLASWSAEERRLALATGSVPLAISSALASLAALLKDGADALLLLVALVPAAYLTLFAFVLPGLRLLRRVRQERLWSFVTVCGLSVVPPWLALYAMCFGDLATWRLGVGQVGWCDRASGRMVAGPRNARRTHLPGVWPALKGQAARHLTGRPRLVRPGLAPSSPSLPVAAAAPSRAPRAHGWSPGAVRRPTRSPRRARSG